MIFKTESGRVGYRKKYRVAGRVRVPVGHWTYGPGTYGPRSSSRTVQASLVARLTGPSAFSALFPEYGYTGPFRGVVQEVKCSRSEMLEKFEFKKFEFEK